MAPEQYVKLTEIIGFMAFVVTLIYMSLPMCQGAELLRSESRLAPVNDGLVGVRSVIEHPGLGRILSATGIPSRADKTRLQSRNVGLLRARKLNGCKSKQAQWTRSH